MLRHPPIPLSPQPSLHVPLPPFPSCSPSQPSRTLVSIPFLLIRLRVLRLGQLPAAFSRACRCGSSISCDSPAPASHLRRISGPKMDHQKTHPSPGPILLASTATQLAAIPGPILTRSIYVLLMTRSKPLQSSGFIRPIIMGLWPNPTSTLTGGQQQQGPPRQHHPNGGQEEKKESATLLVSLLAGWRHAAQR